MNRFALTLLLIALSGTAAAQTYRWTDPASGRTVISNTPPPPGVKAKTGRAAGPDGGSELPLATRQAMRDFPVTLYGGAQCGAPCITGRSLLAARGIPFTEKSADTPAAIEELKRLAGDTALPTLQVGRQTVPGFAEGQWQSLLDLAGYPRTPPVGYRPPPPKAAEASDGSAGAPPPAAGDSAR